MNLSAQPSAGAGSAPLTSREYPLEALPDTLVAEWNRLAAVSGAGAVFASPSFVRTFSEVFGDRVGVSVLAFHDPTGAVCGLVPLMRTKVRRGPSFSVRYAYQMADYAFLKAARPRLEFPAAQISTPLGLEATALRSEILATPTMRAAVLAALPAALARLAGWNVAILVLDADDAATLARGPLRARVRPLNREMKFLSDVRPAEALVALQNKKFRQNVRRSAKFTEEAGARFETLRGRAAVGAAMEEFADLARRSWKAADAGGRADDEDVFIPYTDRQRHFFERLVQTTEAEPVMNVARIDGRMMSAILSLVQHRRLVTFLTFSDLSVARLGIGRLILHEAIDLAHREGLAEVDFNSNAEWTIPYADRVSSRHNVLLMAPGFAGRWRHALASRVGRD